LGFPSEPDLTSVTRWVLRMRLTFHELSSVMTSSRSPSGAPQIAVGFGVPSLVKVVSSRYLDFVDVVEGWGQGSGRLEFDSDVAFGAAP
jgi:hypothetical protein